MIASCPVIASVAKQSRIYTYKRSVCGSWIAAAPLAPRDDVPELFNRGGKPLYGFLALCIFALTPGCGPSAQKLPALGADLSQTSVSGLSSGGYMAGQFHVAHSATVIGAAIFAAGPYGCAESAAAEAFPYFPAATAYNAAQAQNGCMADRLSAVGVLSSWKAG